MYSRFRLERDRCQYPVRRQRSGQRSIRVQLGCEIIIIIWSSLPRSIIILAAAPSSSSSIHCARRRRRRASCFPRGARCLESVCGSSFSSRRSCWYQLQVQESLSCFYFCLSLQRVTSSVSIAEGAYCSFLPGYQRPRLPVSTFFFSGCGWWHLSSIALRDSYVLLTTTFSSSSNTDFFFF
jgi:hypothetical protein